MASKQDTARYAEAYLALPPSMAAAADLELVVRDLEHRVAAVTASLVGLMQQVNRANSALEEIIMARQAITTPPAPEKDSAEPAPAEQVSETVKQEVSPSRERGSERVSLRSGGTVAIKGCARYISLSFREREVLRAAKCHSFRERRYRTFLEIVRVICEHRGTRELRVGSRLFFPEPEVQEALDAVALLPKLIDCTYEQIRRAIANLLN